MMVINCFDIASLSTLVHVTLILIDYISSVYCIEYSVYYSIHYGLYSLYTIMYIVYCSILYTVLSIVCTV